MTMLKAGDQAVGVRTLQWQDTFLQTIHTGSADHQNRLHWLHGTFPQAKQPEREAANSPPLVPRLWMLEGLPGRTICRRATHKNTFHLASTWICSGSFRKPNITIRYIGSSF